MLLLSREADDFIIEHSSEKNEGQHFRFNKSQLTENAWSHLQSLKVFSVSQATSFLLTEKQDHAFNEVLTKLHEQDTAYRFATQLQHTYLIELIHLITKIQQNHLPLFE